MSITDNLYIGVSGLSAEGAAIGIVGDNISNASTIGFKRSRAEFADILGGTLGSDQLGGGVRLTGSQTMFDQGTLQQTGSPLDLAIQGNGLFVVKGSYAGQQGTYYTRDGQFHLDSSGYVVDNQGLRLQGYTIDSAGNRSSTTGDLPLAARQSPPVATTTAKVTMNLDSTKPVPAAWNPANPVGTSTYNTSMTVYDSLGKAHQAEVYFRNQGGGSWEWHAMVDGGELTGGTAGTPTEIASGALTFTTTGALQSQTTVASAASFTGATPNQAINFNFGDDIASGGTGAGTQQTAATSSVTGLDIDGRASGNLTGVAVGADGKIEGSFDNGDKVELAQLAMATVPNEQGLTRAGDGLYQQSGPSGTPVVDVAGQGGRGSVQAGALESSNVDLGTELVTLIAYQRAFEANAKTVTTSDEMLQDVSNLKR